MGSLGKMYVSLMNENCCGNDGGLLKLNFMSPYIATWKDHQEEGWIRNIMIENFIDEDETMGDKETAGKKHQVEF